MVRTLALFQNVLNLLLVVLLGCVIYGKHIGAASPDGFQVLLFLSLSIACLVVAAGLLTWFYERRISRDFPRGDACTVWLQSRSNAQFSATMTEAREANSNAQGH